MSFLKIQTPSNQIFNIDLGTTETDFIKLLACLSNIEQDKIKGLKDKFGNYFTLYSALYNPQANFNYSNVYFLVCSNDNTDKNLNYPILDRFENFPDNEIPISFSHDSNNYFKRKNFHNVSNHPSHSQIRSVFSKSQVNSNVYPRAYQKENQSIPSPYSNKNFSGSCYDAHNAFPYNNVNAVGSFRNQDNLSRGVNMNVFTDSTRGQNLNLKHQYQQNPLNNYENLSRIPNKQNFDMNFNSRNNDSHYSNHDIDYLEKNSYQTDYLSLDNRLRAKNRAHNRSNYTQNNLNRNNLNLYNNLDNHNDYLEQDLDYLKRNLVPENNSYFDNRRNDRVIQSNTSELHVNQSQFTQLPKDLKSFNPEYNRNLLSSYNNLYSSSNNLKILKERKLNESNKLKENSSNNISRDVKQLQIEKYLSIANDLADLNLFENKHLAKIKQLILNENEDITTIFKFFCQDVIDMETLVNGINKILNWTLDKNNRRPDSPDLVLNKNQLVKLIDSLNDSIFDDPADHILLRNLANYQNDFILAAYELYLSDHDIENFIDSVKRFINKYNKPVNNNNFVNQDKDVLGMIYNPEKITRANNNFRNISNVNELRNTNKINSDLKARGAFNRFNQKDLESDTAIRDDNIYFDNNLQNYKLEYHDNDNNYNQNKKNNALEIVKITNNNFQSEENFENVLGKKNEKTNQNNRIHKSIHSSNQSKAVTNLNLNGNGSENTRNNNNVNQFSSFNKPQEKVISTFTTSNYTLHNKNSDNFKQNNQNDNDNYANEPNSKEEKAQSAINNINNNDNNNQNSKQESNNKINTSISSFENLLKFLHTEQRIIFKYAIKNKLPQVNVFAQLYSTIESEDILLRTVKQFCKQFISEKITKSLNENQGNAFKNLMQKRDQNLLGYFKEFNKHNSIEKLYTDISKYLNDNLPRVKDKSDAKNKEANNKENPNNNDFYVSKEKKKEKNTKEVYKLNQKQEKQSGKLNEKKKQKNDKYKRDKSFSSSSSEYEENLENNDDSKFIRREEANNYHRSSSKMQESDNENNDFQNNYYNQNDENSSEDLNKNYKLDDFMKLINNFNFINSQQKQLIENLINENNPDIFQLFESYHKTKNILTMKSSIRSLLKKYRKHSENQGYNNYDSEKRNLSAKGNSESNQNRGGEILSKLEKIKKQNSKNKNESRKINSNQISSNFNQNREANESEEDFNGPTKKKRVYQNNRETNNSHKISGDISKKITKQPESNKIRAYNTNQNYNDESLKRNAKEDQEISDNSSDSPENNKDEKEKKQIIIENKSYESLDELLQDLEENQKISSHQHKYIIQRYKNKDEILLSAWEVYTYNKFLPDLIESLRIFSTNVRRQSTVATMTKTPVALAKSKNDIIDFLKSKDNNREKEEIKKKQLNIIEILVNEKMLDRKTAPIINQMIFEENHFLISAFEIFSVSKDHWEFVETLGMITDIYCNDVKKMSKSSSSLEKVAPVENKDSRLAILFENFIKNNKSFSDNEIDIFRKKLFTKDDFFMSAIEFYENNLDQDEFVENLQQVLK